MFQHVPFLKTIWSQGNWSSKRLTWNILYNDKVETVFAINYGTQFSEKNSSIQNGSISIGRSYSKIAFLIFSGSQKGDPPFEPQFCAQKWRNHNLGEEQGKNPSLLFQQGRPCVNVNGLCMFLFPCKSHGFCSHKGRVSFRNFHSSWRFWKKRNFHGEFGDKGQLTWNILRLILFYPTKRWEFGNPKLKETNFPIDLFSVKLLLSNASRPKSSKMSPTAATLREEWWFAAWGSA